MGLFRHQRSRAMGAGDFRLLRKLGWSVNWRLPPYRLTLVAHDARPITLAADSYSQCSRLTRRAEADIGCFRVYHGSLIGRRVEFESRHWQHSFSSTAAQIFTPQISRHERKCSYEPVSFDDQSHVTSRGSIPSIAGLSAHESNSAT